MPAHEYCIATVVTEKAIETMLEASGQGAYKDDHPWLVAADIIAAAEQPVPILFAVSADGHAHFSHWAFIEQIEVVELHRGQWGTHCRFSRLHAMNPIWHDVDSVFVKASSEQMEREVREGIRVSRIALDEHHIHPYAICETPAFILDQDP